MTLHAITYRLRIIIHVLQYTLGGGYRRAGVIISLKITQEK